MTLKEIAKELNVSPSTVSRVLNGYNKKFSTTPEMRTKILEMVARTNYKPNAVFQSIRAKQNNQIAFVFHSRSLLKSGETITLALDETTKFLEENNYSFHYLFYSHAREEQYRLPEWPVAGIVLSDVVDPERLALIEQRKCPYVTLNGSCNVSGASILSDEEANINEVMHHLQELGHRKIAYFNVPPVKELHYSVLERKNGYLIYLHAHGLPLVGNPEIVSAPISEQFDLAIRQGATAIVTYQLRIAVEVLECAWRRGISVPRDLSVVTFDDFWYGAHSIPPLTCCRIPAAEMGRETGRMILEKIADPNSHQGEILRLPGKLIVRESTAQVRA